MRRRPEEELEAWLERSLGADESPDEASIPRSEDTDDLAPLLSTAQELRAALRPEPREEFLAASRERFLLATGKHLRRALAAQPRPAFIVAARERLLVAAQKVGLKRRRPGPLGLPVPVAGAAVLALSLSAFLAYAVTTSGDSLPGHWQYPVKRSVERTRLALAFCEGDRHDVRVELAKERLWEVETLAEQGRPIGKDLLADLEHETESIAEHLDVAGPDPAEGKRVAEFASHQQAVLADVEPLVEPKARESLEEALVTSREARQKAFQVLALALSDPSEETAAEPDGPRTALAESTPSPGVSVPPDGTEQPSGRPRAEGEATADPTPEATPGSAPEATPTATRRVTAAGLSLGPVPDDNTAGLRWDRMEAGSFSAVVPSADSGWHLTDIAVLPGAPVPTPLLVRVVNVDGTSIIAINPRTGDVYWYVFEDGLFNEIRLRQAADGEVTIADTGLLYAKYGLRAAVPLHIVASIDFSLKDTPTPTATPPPTPTPAQEAPPPVP